MYNLNVAPYYDDYDAAKAFHKILFRPGKPVQTRELTQIQSILQNQINSIGKHLFKTGSMVVPGNISYDLKCYAVNVTLSNTSNTEYVGLKLYGETTKIKSEIVYAEVTGTSAKFIVKPLSVSEDDDSILIYANSEAISIANDDGSFSSLGITATSSASSPASIASINEGIFFIDGYFVLCPKQTILLSWTSATPSVRVGLVVNESIVTEGDDTSLLDPALGSSNENAPGAHRYKIDLVLTKYSLEETTDSSFIILFELNNAEVVKLVQTTDYSEIMKTLARRTYEESGNYIVSDYDVSIKETDPVSTSLNVYGTKGISFVGGYEIDNTSNRLSTTIAKARTTKTIQNSFQKVDIGNYLYVNNIWGLPKIWSYIELRNEATTTKGTVAGSIIGFAKVRGVEKTSVAGIYKVFIFDAEFSSGFSMSSVASISEFNPAASTKTTCDVLNVYTISNITGTFNTTNEVVSTTVATRKVIPVYFDSAKMFAKKVVGSSWLSVGDTIKQTTSLATATTISRLIVNEPSKSVPLIKLPKTAIKSTTDFIYSVYRKFTVSLSSGSGTLSKPTNEDFVDTSKAVGWSSINGAELTLTYNSGTSQFAISGGAGTAGETATIIAIVRKTTNNSQKSKTKQNNTTITYSSPTGKTKFLLGKPDVLSIDSVTEGGVDVSSKFILRNGQSEGALKPAYAELISGATSPTSELIFTFTYLNNAPGDFASVDSYTSLAADESFISLIPSATIKGEQYWLEDCLDFRPTLKDSSVSVLANTTSSSTSVTLAANNSNGLLVSGGPIYGDGVSTTIASILANDTGITLSANATVTKSGSILISGYDTSTYSAIPTDSMEAVASISDFVLDFDFYLPRIDTLCITSNGNFELISGSPAEIPIKPSVVENEFRMCLVDLTIPAYTFDVFDIKKNFYDRRRYTMKDIGNIEKRISALEETTALNLLEQEVANLQIIDPTTGLNRFKSGFVVDNFKSYSLVDYSDASICQMDTDNGILKPLNENYAINTAVILNEGVGYVIEEDVLTLAYTEEVLIEQDAATTSQNINPFGEFVWEGNLKITPGKDYWVETKTIINGTLSSTTVESGSFDWLYSKI